MISKHENLGALTFGLDIGIASVGWAVLGESRIIDLGVRCFDKAETEVSPVFHLPRGGVHATSFSFCCVISQLQGALIYSKLMQVQQASTPLLRATHPQISSSLILTVLLYSVDLSPRVFSLISQLVSFHVSEVPLSSRCFALASQVHLGRIIQHPSTSHHATLTSDLQFFIFTKLSTPPARHPPFGQTVMRKIGMLCAC